MVEFANLAREIAVEGAEVVELDLQAMRAIGLDEGGQLARLERVIAFLDRS